MIQYFKSHKFLFILAICLLGVSGARLGLRGKLSQGTLTEPLKKGPVIESVYGIGTVTAFKTYQVKLGVTSTIRNLHVKEGDPVKRGQPLVDLEGPVSVTAPFDGTVTYLPVKIGENVFAQSVILSLSDLRDRYIVVSLEQRAVLRVRQGQKARISFENMRGESFDGLVQSVYSHENNFLVRIGVERLPPQILPGMTADVAIGIGEIPGALLAPLSAVEEGKVVIDRGSGRPQTVAVKLGVVDGDMAQIISGDVREGDRLLIKNGGNKK